MFDDAVLAALTRLVGQDAAQKVVNKCQVADEPPPPKKSKPGDSRADDEHVGKPLKTPPSKVPTLAALAKVTLPTEVSCQFHQASMSCLAGTGSIKAAMPLAAWSAATQKRYSIKNWSERVASLGLKNPPTSRGFLIECRPGVPSHAPDLRSAGRRTSRRPPEGRCSGAPLLPCAGDLGVVVAFCEVGARVADVAVELPCVNVGGDCPLLVGVDDSVARLAADTAARRSVARWKWKLLGLRIAPRTVVHLTAAHS